MTPVQQRYWDYFLSQTGRARDTAAYDVTGFGDRPAMRDWLLGEVLIGRKRATCGLQRYFPIEGLAMPAPGDLTLILDGADMPRCVIETTSVEIGPVISVTDDFAWEEGEGTRSRFDWLRQHRRFFIREAAGHGLPYNDDLPAVFERFRVVWPPRFAD